MDVTIWHQVVTAHEDMCDDKALSALYPSHTEEKRWVDGVLARKKVVAF